MPDRVQELEQRVAAIEQRLDSLERKTPEPRPAEVEPPEEPTLGESFVTDASTLIGRVLLIFGGAYLLRAITDYQVVPTGLGLSLGAAYAVFWLFRAFVVGRDPDYQATALFYAVASILLVLPLLAEATGRFAMLSGVQAIIALTAVCVLYLAVAVSRQLRLLAWAVVAGGIITAFAVLQISHSALPFTAFLILLGLLSLWVCYSTGWNGPQWVAGIGAAVGVIVLTVLTQSEQWNVDVRSAYAAGSALLLAYLVSAAIRTHRQRHAIGAFESIQTLLAVAVMVLTVFAVLRNGSLTAGAIGGPALLLAAGTYALAFTRGTRTERGRNFHYYSTMGLLLLVVGSSLLLAPVHAAALWSLLAVVLAWSSGRYARVSLSLQCTFLLIAAGTGSGLLETGLVALAGGMPETWPAMLPWHALVAVATVVCLFIPVAQQSERWGKLAGLPQLIVLALSVWEVGGLIVVVTAPLLVDFSAADPSRAVLAALRTTILAAASVTLALSSRFPRWPEARWLVYPVLILVGFKLFVEDFPHGQPVTLFIALALVGSALILVARLLAPRSSAD